MPTTLKELTSRKEAILLELAGLGDMRAGSISENYRRCGSSSCHCAKDDDRRHGPYYAYTWKEEGRTRTRNLRAGPQLDELRVQVAEYRRFRRLSQERVEISEAICDLRSEEKDDSAWVKKKRRRSSRRSSHGR